MRPCSSTLAPAAASLNAKLRDASDEELAEKQRELSRLYDRFSMRYGYIDKNLKKLSPHSPVVPFLRALEVQTGKHGYKRAALLSQRTIRPARRRADSYEPKEALLVSLNDRGRVDPDYIVELCRRPFAEVLPALDGLVFETNGGAFVTAEEYLSGDIRQKLRDAEAATQFNPAFEKNVAALRSLLPPDLGRDEISVRLGSSWAPEEIVRDFIIALVPSFKGAVKYIPALAVWKIEGVSPEDRSSIEATRTWGTKRVNVFELAEDILNLRTTSVTDEVPEPGGGTKIVVNDNETIAAQAKQIEIKQKFASWVWIEEGRTVTLVRIYNERFNSFRKRECDGSHILLPGMNSKITLYPHLESVLVREEKSGRIERLCLKDLTATRPGDPSDSIRACELSSVDEIDWQTAEERFATIRPLLAEARRTRESVAIQAQAAKVNTATVYRWLDIYERTGRVSALLPTKPNGGRGKSRLSPEVETVIKETLENYYLKQQKPSAQKTCLEVIRLCRQAELKPPHPNTIRQRIAAISEELKMKRRQGAKAAREKFEPAIGAFPGADWPLAYVQIDHTKLDIILVDDMHRLPVGRPWLTLAVDVFSRMVTGLYVSFDPPGAMSVGLCLTHSILPKEKWLAKYNISTPWPCWGVIGTLHADNAGEFRGQMLRRACAEYGINLEWRPVAQPNYGTHIERLLGTVLKEIHSLPGSTFSEPKEKGAYDSEKEAAMTLSELEECLAVFITQVYHQRVHSELRASPIKRYEEGILGTKERPGTGLPHRVLDEDRLRLDFMPHLERTIQPRGVVVDEIYYFS